MNEQFKALAEQAGFAFWENEPWKPEGELVDWASNYDEQLVKFAELIVRECARRIEGCHLARGYDLSTLDQYEMGYKRGIDKASSQVKLHFGIENDSLD